MYKRLERVYLHKVDDVSMDFVRYLYEQINWDNQLIMIKGPKGVGKTTMILQHIHRMFPDRSKAFYASVDSSYFGVNSIVDLAEYVYTHGVTHLFLDEVHKYHGWDQQIKEVYDAFPKLHVVITGSSMLRLEESDADLGRRCRQYTMQGLSFREYLLLEGIVNWEPVSLDDILKNHTTIAAHLTNEKPILGDFETYLKKGYYPFYREEGDGFEERLDMVIGNILQTEIPAVEKSIEYESVYKMKILLSILASQNPYTLNIKELCEKLACSREVLYKMLHLLHRAQLIRRLYEVDGGMKILEKPEKILFDNTNIMYALTETADVGTMRETFFSNMLGGMHALSMPTKGDMLVDGKYLFEVGGPSKGYKQIAGIQDSFVVRDGIDVGSGNKIPLWLFGLLY